MQGEDFGGESVQVGGEGGEGDVFGGFLVVVAELLKECLLVFEVDTIVDGLLGMEMAYLDRHKHVVRRGVALDLFDHDGPVAAFAERYCCCSAVA